MSLRHLTRDQNQKIGELLLGVAKAVLTAGIIAFLYPPSGQVRSFEWLLVALAISGVLAYIGLSLDERDVESNHPNRKRRR